MGHPQPKAAKLSQVSCINRRKNSAEHLLKIPCLQESPRYTGTLKLLAEEERKNKKKHPTRTNVAYRKKKRHKVNGKE